MRHRDAEKKDEYDLLEITIMRAFGLRKADYFGKSDPYISFCIIDDQGHETQVVKTTVIEKTINPTINEKFTFTFRGINFDKSLKFIMKDWDRLSKDDFLGQSQI